MPGSLSQVTQFYYMQDPNKLDAFESYKTFPQRVRDTHRNEFSVFFKDDWKVLNESHAEPRHALGLLRVDLRRVRHDAAGRWRRLGDLRSLRTKLDDWMKPGIRGELTAFEYVGKNSPNPDKT